MRPANDMDIGAGRKDAVLVENRAEFHRHFTSDPLAVADVIETLIKQFQDYCLHDPVVANIEIVLSEVINNINEHAYRGELGRPIEIHAQAQPSGIAFLLVDCGIEMPGGAIPDHMLPDLSGDVTLLPEGGFGMGMIRQVAHDVKYVRKNGENHLSFRVTIDGENPPN